LALQRRDIDLANRGITAANGGDLLDWAGGFLLDRVFGARGSLDLRHDKRWLDITLEEVQYGYDAQDVDVRTSFRALMTTCVPLK